MTALEEIAAFADVPMDIEAELDRRILTVAQILQMEPGSLIGMKRSAGENIDLYVGGTLIGCGEIVVVENSLGVRITDFNGDAQFGSEE
jgi:flagellar motor switch protein FliN